jgi:hypothetical protein
MHGGRSAIVVATIAHVHMQFANSVAYQVINLLHLFGQRVVIKGILRETSGTDEPSPAVAAAVRYKYTKHAVLLANGVDRTTARQQIPVRGEGTLAR